MAELTPAENAVLNALRTGLGARASGEQLAHDPQRGWWVSYALRGADGQETLPLQVAVSYLARKVEAGQSAEDAVMPIVAGPPPAALLPTVRVHPAAQADRTESGQLAIRLLVLVFFLIVVVQFLRRFL